MTEYITSDDCRMCGKDIDSGECDCSEEDYLAWVLHGRKADSDDMHGGVIFSHAAAEIERLRDRLARLEDGIRALADVCDVYDTDDVQIHPQWVTKRLRAILGEDGE